MNLRATLGGLFAIVLWSTSVALARSVSRQLGPLNAAAVVYTFGGVVGLGWSLVRQPGAMRVMLGLPRRYLLGCGGLFVFYTAAFFLALGLAEDHQQSIALGLVNYLWPALTILFSLPLLHARASWVLVPGTLLGLAGMAVVLSQGQSIPLAAVPEAMGRNPVAFACALAAAVSWRCTRTWRGAGPAPFGGRRAVVRARGGRAAGGHERTSFGSRSFTIPRACRGRADGRHGAGCLCLLGSGDAPGRHAAGVGLFVSDSPSVDARGGGLLASDAAGRTVAGVCGAGGRLAGKLVGGRALGRLRACLQIDRKDKKVTTPLPWCLKSRKTEP